MAVGFFSAAPTAQNSPELHFRFVNSFIKPSLVSRSTGKISGSVGTVLILIFAHLN
jgi:hypothetical protein